MKVAAKNPISLKIACTILRSSLLSVKDNLRKDLTCGARCSYRCENCQHPLVQKMNIGVHLLYLALGNIALVFAAQVCRDSEIAGISMGLAMGSLSPSLSVQLITRYSLG